MVSLANLYIRLQLKKWIFTRQIFWWRRFTLYFKALCFNFRGNVAAFGCYDKKSLIDLDLFGKNVNNLKCPRPVLTHALKREHTQCKVQSQEISLQVERN